MDVDHANIVTKHAVYCSLVLFQIVWTLYMDITYDYGWQRGGWKGKFTHWALVVTLLYFIVAQLAISVPFMGEFRSRLLYFTLTVMLNVDLSFCLVLLPRRALGLEKARQVMGATSTHKHLVNLFWVLGEAVLHARAYDGDNVGKIDKNAFITYGVVLPCMFSAAYLIFATSVHHIPTAKIAMSLMGIGEAGDHTTSVGWPPQENLTVIPGQWVYGMFKKTSIRFLFLVTPVGFACLNYLMLGQLVPRINRNMANAIGVFVAIISPALYIPLIMRAKTTTKKGV